MNLIDQLLNEATPEQIEQVRQSMPVEDEPLMVRSIDSITYPDRQEGELLVHAVLLQLPPVTTVVDEDLRRVHKESAILALAWLKEVDPAGWAEWNQED